MDTLYYSNFCKHCQKVLQAASKSGAAQKMNFLCVDKRRRDVHNNQLLLVLENGSTVTMPPHVHSVPALMVGKGFHVLFGEDEILRYIQQQRQGAVTQSRQVEPCGVSLSTFSNHGGITSEMFTMYNLSSDELSSKGLGGRRSLNNYVSASHDGAGTIPTPPETYKPDKVGGDVTLDMLSQKRNQELPVTRHL
jgi:hypothetical protein